MCELVATTGSSFFSRNVLYPSYVAALGVRNTSTTEYIDCTSKSLQILVSCRALLAFIYYY